MDNGEETGFTRYVTSSEFTRYCSKNQDEHNHISDALWGSQRTNGIVKDIHDLKMWIKFLGIVGGIVSPIITAFLIRWLVNV